MTAGGPPRAPATAPTRAARDLARASAFVVPGFMLLIRTTPIDAHGPTALAPLNRGTNLSREAAAFEVASGRRNA